MHLLNYQLSRVVENCKYSFFDAKHYAIGVFPILPLPTPSFPPSYSLPVQALIFSGFPFRKLRCGSTRSSRGVLFCAGCTGLSAGSIDRDGAGESQIALCPYCTLPFSTPALASVASVFLSLFGRAKIGASTKNIRRGNGEGFLSSVPSPSLHFFALAPIFARPKSEICFKPAKYPSLPTQTLATRATQLFKWDCQLLNSMSSLAREDCVLYQLIILIFDARHVRQLLLF